MPNRLAGETSPYLLQHKDNPVDWYPWGDEAFALAQAQDKPVFLSVGYSSCHWCHVMEHESFEDESIAVKLNQDFVPIKVDREERPDVDETYMTAVQLSSGRGGWPMSVFLTPDKKPFFAGTYFPKEERGGHPGFSTVLQQIADVWSHERSKVQEIANQFADAIRQSHERDLPASATVGPSLLDDCVRALTMDFDEDHGGFGPAPKFPPHTAIELLLNYAIGEFGEEDLRQSAADMALFTLEKMALGGLHDHVGGGFHRYSTDERWLLPHFEKMLYDNALLLGNYARAASLCHGQLPDLEALFGRAVEGIIRWLREEMVSPEGLFYSALDADSEGEEGKFYVWTAAGAAKVLGTDTQPFLTAYQFHPDGNFRDEATGHVTGANIPHLLEFAGDRFDGALSRLREERASRVRPGLDDKALVGWNGLMIGALAEAGEIGMAERAATAILDAERSHGRLPRQIAKGKPSGDGFLEDYAYLADGLIVLAGVKSLFTEQVGASEGGLTPDDLMTQAQRLVSEMLSRFWDEKGSGFFGTSTDHEELFGRGKPCFDQPTPAPNAVAAKCLAELGDEQRALQTVTSFAGWMERAPAATEALHLALMSLLQSEIETESRPKEVQVTMDSGPLMAINGVATGLIRIAIPDDLHLNSPNPPARWLIPTEVLVEPLEYRVHYPEAVWDKYEGDIEIPFEIDLPAGMGAEEFELTVKYQACTDTECHLPQERKFSGIVQAT